MILCLRRLLLGQALGCYLGMWISSPLVADVFEPKIHRDPPPVYEPHHDDPGFDDSDLVEI